MGEVKREEPGGNLALHGLLRWEKSRVKTRRSRACEK